MGEFLQVLSRVETAAELGVKPKTLDNWRLSNQGPRFLKIGGRVAYRLEDLQEYLKTRVYVSTTEQTVQDALHPPKKLTCARG